MIDVHCHLMTFGDDEDFGFLHQNFLNNCKMQAYLKWIGMPKKIKIPRDKKLANQLFEKILKTNIDESSLDHVVVIALDGVYENGIIDRDRTLWYVSNEAVLEFAKKSKKNNSRSIYQSIAKRLG